MRPPAALLIVGIDPGLRFTGWGIIRVDGTRLSHVADGVIRTDSAAPLGDRLKQIHDGLAQMLASHTPDEAAVEETFVNVNARATLKLGQARGVAMLVPALHGLVIAEYAPNVVKKSVVGVGHAQKEQVHHMVKLLLPRANPASADAADALAIAICHAHQRTRPA